MHTATSMQRTTQLATLLLPLVLAACSDSDNSSSGGPPIATTQNLLETLETRGLTTLVTAIQAAGLGSLLEGPGPLTLFGPTNAAFEALPPGELQRLLDPLNMNELRALLEYHLVASELSSSTLLGLTSVMSIEGSDLLVDSPGGVLFVNEARVVADDVEATNGVLHEVDAVVMPPTSLLATLEARGFTILRDLIDRAGLAGALTGANVTLVAPTDEAFLALPPGRLDELRDPVNQAELIDVLTFHVLPGRRTALELLFAGDTENINGDLLFVCVHGHRIHVNDTDCSRFNVPATDGLLHIAVAVLTPTVTLREQLTSLGLTTLAGLVDLAGLDVPLSAPGTFTLFGPSETAFAALNPLFVAFLQDPVNVSERLDFLNRHLLVDALQAVEIARRDELAMQNGQVFVVDPTNGLRIGGVLVTNEDEFATNGVVHVIDEVLPQP
jgi:transforming growth factor-beta-induced protein